MSGSVSFGTRIDLLFEIHTRTMKNLISLLTLAVCLSACSTCYECYSEVPIIDANTGDTISTTSGGDEFCTADPSEVDAREAEGQTCEIQ